jgi:hypothetical protein
VCLSPVPPSPDAEADVNLVLLRERRNNRVRRTLAPGQRIRQPRRQLKSRAAVLKGKTQPGSDHSRAVARVVTLDQRNDISVLVDCRKVDRRIAGDRKFWFSDTYVRTSAGWRYVFGQSSLPLADAAALPAAILG